MGITFIISKEDNQKILQLKKQLGLCKKIDVIRAALALLEKEDERIKRIKRWKHAAKLVSKSSKEINEYFQGTRIKL